MTSSNEQPAAAVLNAKAQHTQGKSLQSFLASLAVAGATFGTEILLFLLLRAKLPGVYRPRSSQSDTLGVDTSDAETIKRCGLDAYLFLRYLRVLLRIFIPLACVILPILIPLNIYGGRGSGQGVNGLDRTSWTNIASTRTDRYWAHLCLSVVVVLWVCRVFWYETRCYTRLRQKRMMSQLRKASGTTILVTDIPEDLLSKEHLERLYDIYPGGVRRVWLQRDYSKLKQKIQEREECALTLEAAETRLIEKASQSHKASPNAPVTLHAGQPLWKRYLSLQDREQYTLPLLESSWFPSIPYLGKRVDLIDHSRERLASLNEKIILGLRMLEGFKAQGSALIEFKEAHGAHMACRSIHHPSPHLMTSKKVEETTSHIIWKNISMGWWERYIRTLSVGGAIVCLCIGCIVPVAFTGLLSQLNDLASISPRLEWLKHIPGWSQGVLQGVLPPCLLSVVTIVLPIILERLILEQGVHTDTSAELLLQDYYFGFLFLQLFLVVSVSSSVAAVLGGLGQDFQSLAALIAQNLPKAGNYFFSYMLLQGLSVSAAALLQLTRLLNSLIAPLWDKTARQKWERLREPEMKWGTLFPVYTNLAAIGLIYSIVSPLILLFNIATFGLFLAVQQYNVLNVSRSNTDTGGLIYPKAINQLFTGLYVMELYLVGLFILVRDEQNRPACVGQVVIMVLVLCFTLVYQRLLTHAYGPLFQSLPVMISESDRFGEPNHTSNRKAGPGANKFLCILDRLEILDTFLGRYIRIDQIDPRSLDAEFDPGTTEEPLNDVRDEVLLAQQPVIWLPNDALGISNDEINQIRKISKHIRISNQNADLGHDGKVRVLDAPPDGNHIV